MAPETQLIIVIAMGRTFTVNEPMENIASGLPISLMNRNFTPLRFGRWDKNEYAAIKKGI